MKFPGAPYGLKMACGENPKRVYGIEEAVSLDPMGNVAGYRAGLGGCAGLRREVEGLGEGEEGRRPRRAI